VFVRPAERLFASEQHGLGAINGLGELVLVVLNILLMNQ
jgi:hypothetical protein